jgi:hypothetical protein
MKELEYDISSDYVFCIHCNHKNILKHTTIKCDKCNSELKVIGGITLVCVCEVNNKYEETNLGDFNRALVNEIFDLRNRIEILEEKTKVLK